MMIGLLIAVFVFNLIAFIANKRLSRIETAHIWSFTIAFQAVFDTYVDAKFHGYWYFSKDIDWESLPAILFLVPPINVMFLNWYPYNKSAIKKILYFLYWEAFMLVYELISLLPEPWGHFYYGWWRLWISALLNPILLIIVLVYYLKFVKTNSDTLE